MSVQQIAQELVQIQKELTPIQEDIYAFLNQKDEIPIYKIEHVIPFMMYRYCQLINQQVDANRRLDMLVTMQAAKERYDEKAHEEEEECQVSKEEEITTEEEFRETLEELEDDEDNLKELAHNIESFVNENGHIPHWKITIMLRKFTDFIETRNEIANKRKKLEKYRKDNEEEDDEDEEEKLKFEIERSKSVLENKINVIKKEMDEDKPLTRDQIIDKKIKFNDYLEVKSIIDELKTNLDECLENKKKKSHLKMIIPDSDSSPIIINEEEEEEKKE